VEAVLLSVTVTYTKASAVVVCNTSVLCVSVHVTMSKAVEGSFTELCTLKALNSLSGVNIYIDVCVCVCRGVCV